jgi:ABC-2 type transport system ATP-binding protein
MSPPLPLIIQVDNLVKKFGTVTAIDLISFTLAEGSITALLGGNGAGKTTTLSILLGVLLPTSGTIQVLNVDMLRDRHQALPQMNFSSPYVDMPRRLSARENLTVYGHLYGLDGIKQRIADLANELEIDAYLDRPTSTLSAGQKTRVALAKALLNEPKLLIMDEPTASLDPDTGDWIRGYLERYRHRTGASILLASHNMGEVERLCDHVLMMRQGSIVDEGSPTELIRRFGHSNLEEVFLDIAREGRDDSHKRSA